MSKVGRNQCYCRAPETVEASPTIATMRQPLERISREMARLLLGEIDGERPAAITIPTELVVRESA